MDLGLSGLRALVTGASRGLGYATAKCLADEGARLAINSRSQQAIADAAQRLSAETGGQAIGLAGDVSESGAPQWIVDEAARQLGGLDLLVTNAGGPPTGKFENFDENTWQKAVDLSFMAHVRLIRAALPYLRRSKAASVLTITSLSAKQPIENLVLSNSVRLATVGLTKSLALELGTEGIRFNSILPAWTMTERVDALMETRASASGATIEEETRKLAGESALGRLARPDEFARAAAFLLSPAASYITGVMLPVDGGFFKGVL